MPQAIMTTVREQIVQRCQQARSRPVIAVALGVSERTVRRIWRRYKEHGKRGLAPDYARCGQAPRGYSQTMRQRAVALKRAHPSWGAGLIRITLKEKFPTETQWPSERTLQVWFQQAGVNTEHKRHAQSFHGRGKAPHEVWEMDAKEGIHLGDGGYSSVVSVLDEASGAALAAQPFPPPALEPRGGR